MTPTFSIPHRYRLASLVCTASIASTLLLSAPALSQTGSYTLGTLFPTTVYLPGDSVKVTAKDKDGNTYNPDFGIQIGGLTTQQARDLIIQTLRNAGWAAHASPSGTNSIIIDGRYKSPNGTPKDSTIVPMREVDFHLFTTVTGGTIRDFFVDGDCPFKVRLENPKDFKFSFVRPNAGATAGTVFCDLNAIHVTAALPSNATPIQAATALQGALSGAGLVVSRSDSTVTLNWDVPTNASLLGSSLHINLGVLGGSGGPHVKLAMPSVVIAVPGMGRLSLFLALMLLTAVGTLRLRRSRADEARS
jgi:hypothetical protein